MKNKRTEAKLAVRAEGYTSIHRPKGYFWIALARESILEEIDGVICINGKTFIADDGRRFDLHKNLTATERGE